MGADTRGGHRWDLKKDLIRAIERFTMKHGVDPTMADLVRVMKVTKQTLSVRLRRARELGYVGRRPGAVDEDGKATLRWYATAAGKGLLER